MSLIPNAFPVSLAAFIDSKADRTFRTRVIEPGLVELDDHGRVTRASLERHLGFPISVERYLAADRRRDGARRYQQNYRDARKMEATLAVTA